MTNLRNRRSVEIEIHDRGPFVEDRIIDLSQAAARALGIIDRGTAKVNIEFIDDETACVQARNPNPRRGQAASRVSSKTIGGFSHATVHRITTVGSAHSRDLDLDDS